MTRLARAVPFLILAGCAACAWRGRTRAAALRARWAWRCRKPPARSDGDPLDERERAALTTIRRGWKTAAPERSRT